MWQFVLHRARRVAQLPVAGNPFLLTARAGAAKTVESHLGRAYMRLGVRSRAELPQSD